MSNSFNPRIGLSISPEERNIIDMYMSQYNQTNVQINRLYTTLDSIRTNINNIINNNRINNDNMSTINSTVEPTHTSASASASASASYPRAATNASTSTSYPRVDTNASTNPRAATNASTAAYSRTNNTNNMNNRNNNRHNNRNNNQYIYYDYDHPISPTTYVDDEVFTPINISDNINTLLAAFLATPVTVRPTESQITDATRIIKYSDIENPVSAACPISLDNFSENDNVRQINHCGHVFSLNSIDEWFQNNVRCPVCRYDIRTATAATTATVPDLFEPPLINARQNARQNARPNARQNANAIQSANDTLDSITTSLFASLLSYPARINGTRTTNANTNANTNTNDNDNDNDNSIDIDIEDQLTYDASQNTLTYETTFRPFHR